MGLAGPKNKRKLGNDPNNTKWSRNTDSFGHRMLRSQGWQPGQFLGPQDSAHAAFHTAASASHIRVALKDDNLGLGAKINRGDECTGLNAFKEMLARLNGKSEAAIEQDKKAKEDHMRSVYIERKFGTVRFVRGGFLVGDKMEESTKIANKDGASKKSEDSAAASSAEGVVEAKVKKEKKSKKRKADDAEVDARSKEERRSDRKKRRKEASETGGGDNRTPETENDASSTESKSRSKKEKEKKEKRKLKEEGAAAAEKDSVDNKSGKRKDKTKEKKKTRDSEGNVDEEPSRESTAAPPTGASTPTGSGTSTPVSQVSARFLSRRRFIAQKRMALNDPQALNQVKAHIPRSFRCHVARMLTCLDLHDKILMSDTPRSKRGDPHRLPCTFIDTRGFAPLSSRRQFYGARTILFPKLHCDYKCLFISRNADL
ncbi:hypothetical protein RB596_004984 [Gaeumannomyces avenae]